MNPLAVHPLRLLPVLLCACSLLAGPETSLKLVWSDEFNEKEIDKKKWNINNADGVKIVDGQLSLEITPGSKPMFWRGSSINSRGKYSSKAGYIEASILFLQTGGHGCGFGIGNEDGKAPSAGMGFSNGGGDSVGVGLWIVNEERGRNLSPKENPVPRDPTYSRSSTASASSGVRTTIDGMWTAAWLTPSESRIRFRPRLSRCISPLTTAVSRKPAC